MQGVFYILRCRILALLPLFLGLAVAPAHAVNCGAFLTSKRATSFDGLYSDELSRGLIELLQPEAERLFGISIRQ
jgi:hypothetical protein